MTDLITTFRVQQNVVRFWLRNVREAKANAAKWPHLDYLKRHVAYCEHELAETMHRYCGHPKPEPLPPVDAAQVQRDHIEWVLSIPLPRSRVA